MLSILSLLLLTVCGCATQREVLKPSTAAAPVIRQLDVGRGTNAYVVMGTGPILIDTGWGNSTQKLQAALLRIGVDAKELRLIVLTHGHGDHAGGAARMRELSGAKVVAGQGDVEMLAAGHNRPLKPMSFLGKLLRGYSDKPFPPLTPDIVLGSEFDLGPYGVEGSVVPMPGHTPGSLVIILKNGDTIVGDMMRGGIVRSHSPARHFFHDDCQAAEAHIAPLVQAGSKRFFVGHGGPLAAADVLRTFSDDPCPK